MESNETIVQTKNSDGASDEEKEEGFLTRFRDPAYRSRFFYWMWLPVGTFTLGIVVSQNGPTFPDLQIITDTDKETASLFFTTSSAGYLVGSVLAGTLHGKVDNKLVMIVAHIMAGGTTIATPYCSSFVAMLFVRFGTNIFGGAIDTSINAEHMRIWGNQGESLLQVIHFSFAFGGIFGPLFTEPFLAEKENKTSNAANVTESPHVGVERSLVDHTSNVYQLHNQSGFGNITGHHRTTDVHYAFLIGGIIWASTAIPFIILLLKDCGKKKVTEEKKKETYTQEPPKRELPKFLFIFVIFLLCIFNIAYCSVELIIGSYLVTFLIDEYDEVSKSEATYITTYYWASFAAARFASIFLSKWFTGARHLYLHFSLMLIAFIGIYVSAHFGKVDALTGFTCVAGISLSAVFPAMFSWTEAEVVRVTGRIAAVFIIGTSLGGIIMPYLVGHLMEEVSNMWFCYMLLVTSGSAICLFLFLLFFNRLYINKKFGTLGEGRAIEKEIDPPSTQ